MFNYVFAKYIDAEALRHDIKVAQMLHYIEDIHVCNNTVTIYTKYQLTEQEEKKLRAIIVAHTPIDPTVNLAKKKVEQAMEFGRQILAEYAAMNTLARVPVPVLIGLMGQLLPIQTALQTGSLYTAIDLLEKIQPSPYVPATMLKYFINKIRRYLELPLI